MVLLVFHPVLQGFLVPFLIENGYTNIQIGIISSFISLMTVIAQPMWGFLCDRFETVKKILVPAMLVSGIIVAALPSFRNNFWLVLTISSVYSLTANLDADNYRYLDIEIRSV